MARLAKDVLAEIPDQLLSFMKNRGIEPRPPLPASSDSPSMSTTTTTTAAPKERNKHAWQAGGKKSTAADGHLSKERCVFVFLCVYVLYLLHGLKVGWQEPIQDYKDCVHT